LRPEALLAGAAAFDVLDTQKGTWEPSIRSKSALEMSSSTDLEVVGPVILL